MSIFLFYNFFWSVSVSIKKSEKMEFQLFFQNVIWPRGIHASIPIVYRDGRMLLVLDVDSGMIQSISRNVRQCVVCTTFCCAINKCSSVVL